MEIEVKEVFCEGRLGCSMKFDGEGSCKFMGDELGLLNGGMEGSMIGRAEWFGESTFINERPLLEGFKWGSCGVKKGIWEWLILLWIVCIFEKSNIMTREDWEKDLSKWGKEDSLNMICLEIRIWWVWEFRQQ